MLIDKPGIQESVFEAVAVFDLGQTSASVSVVGSGKNDAMTGLTNMLSILNATAHFGRVVRAWESFFFSAQGAISRSEDLFLSVREHWERVILDDLRTE
ncbi:MAG: hypothetical protein Q9183_000906 [Haloplaca sp. 2 TL-2023]